LSHNRPHICFNWEGRSQSLVPMTIKVGTFTFAIRSSEGWRKELASALAVYIRLDSPYCSPTALGSFEN
jgi:hypothetical protein